MTIEPEDRLARAVVFDDAFRDGRLDQSAILQFRGDVARDGSREESLYLMRLAEPDEVHEQGCRLAANKNLREIQKLERKGLAPEIVSGVNRKYYCGFVTGQASMLLLDCDRYTTRVELVEDAGCAFHVAIHVTPKGERLRPGEWTEVGSLLAERFTEAFPHVCGCDQGDQHQPVNNPGAEVVFGSFQIAA